ncbi:hypothetical protein BT69DRAFT_1316264 [Atractiella rhizophila]|nr:hypothetical protein BT69DRAFT_1316264 [Atractiella rhizophila]
MPSSTGVVHPFLSSVVSIEASIEVKRHGHSTGLVTLHRQRARPFSLDAPTPLRSHLSRAFQTIHIHQVAASIRPSLPPSKIQLPSLPTEPLDRSRYSLPSLPSAQDSLNNASSQLAHQSIRLSHLEMLSKLGGDKWKLVNWELEKEVARFEEGREGWEGRREEINRMRKAEQESTGVVLEELERRWREGLSRVVMLDVENARLEQEVRALEEDEKAVRERLQERGVKLDF